MNRSWITAFTLAAVAGSGGAFAGVIANSNETPVAAQTPPAAQAPAAFSPAAFVRAIPQAPSARTVMFQVGAAGTAAVSINNGSLVIDSALPGSGWAITNASGPGAHVEVQFTDGTQLVTFAAELIGSDIAVGVTNAPVSTPVTAAPPAPITVDAVQATHTTAVPHTTPVTTAQPVPADAAPVSVSATTAPGGGDDGRGDDDHEGESNND